MKPLHRTLLAAAVAATLGVAAVAQTQAPVAPAVPSAPAPAPAQAQAQADRMQQKAERKLGRLKEQLKITSAQEAAWADWASAVKPGQRMQRPSREEFAALSTPERIDRLRALRAQRNAEMDRRLDATRNFYAALTPDQQKVFDGASLRFMKRHHGREGMFRRG